MPTTVLQLFSATNLQLTDPVRWGQCPQSQSPGVYIVSLSNDPSLNSGTRNKAPLSLPRIRSWICAVPQILLDGVSNPTPESIAARLSKYWLPDENILYIGMTERCLAQRIQQYYKTILGRRGPHAGGHWIKTLSNRVELYIYYAECQRPHLVESKLLEEFVARVSQSTREKLCDREHPFPFGNLEYPKGKRKRHRISKSRM